VHEEQGAEKRGGNPRATWMVRKYRLGNEPSDDLSDSTTPEERLAMMWPLALEAWTLSASRIPSYDRRAAPVRKLRRPTV
jgi:hypothetical protein